MAMNIYSDTPANGPISFAIHLDTTKTVDGGAGTQIPDPTWVEWYTFGPKPAGFAGTNNAWANQCKNEAKLLAREERQKRNRVVRKATDLGAPEVDNS